MNVHWNEAMTLIAELAKAESQEDWSQADVVIFPPALYIRHAMEFLKNGGSNIGVGVQNCAATENGAFTGELSASMIREIGAGAVLIGHSERREYFNETDDVLLAKTRRAIQAGLIPYFCCGEQLEDRRRDEHKAVVSHQLQQTVFTLSPEEFSSIVIAYEPVWAIGTGETASPDQAQDMHSLIRALIAETYDEKTADATRIVYGGSMKAENAIELLSQADVDGGLIGGASLSASNFDAIIRA